MGSIPVRGLGSHVPRAVAKKSKQNEQQQKIKLGEKTHLKNEWTS